MTPERFKQVGNLYNAALELEPAQRAAYLADACGSDQELLQEVESLLRYAARDLTLIDRPALEQLVQTPADATPPPLIRQSIGHFQIVAPLGAGGMGEVWLAEDTRLSRKVAIKLLPPEFMHQPERVRRFAQEARAASALNHPNIITIYEIGEIQREAGAASYIVAEYIEGETLRKRIGSESLNNMAGRMPLLEALNFAIQIASALVAAHEAGITHRDIKPENVMVRPDGYVKVLDFGLAKLTMVESANMKSQAGAKPGTKIGTLIGTPQYMSPEQARGEEVDARTDIFSLGVMLYEMVAGRGPFQGATTNESLVAILRDEPLPLTDHAPEAGAELEDIVSRTLRKDRAERYQTAAALLADLKDVKQRIELKTVMGGDSAKLFNPALDADAARVSQRRKVVLSERDWVLLADFDNRTSDALFEGTLRQALAIQLQQSPFLGLFPEERVRQTLRLMMRSPEERVTVKIAREICVRHNLKALISGSITPLGKHYVIAVEAIHGQTGEILAIEQVQAKSKEQVLRALARATKRLRAKLGESLSSIQRSDTGLEETTTQKLEAFQAYSLGYEQSLNGRMMDAIPLYRRAVELDPDFAYAWSMLSVNHSLIGRSDLAAEDAEKAYALKNRVSDYEQLAITFRFHFMVTGDMNKAIDAAVVFKRTYPRTSTAPIDLLVAYDSIGQHDQAVAQGRDAIRLNPNFAPAYWYLGRALLRVDRFAEAKGVFNQALEQKFDLTNIHAALYLIALSEGDTDSQQQELNWANGKPEKYIPLDWKASAAAFAGQWRQAQEFSRLSIELAAHSATKELAARYAVEQALRGAALGDCRRAQADAAESLQIAATRVSLPRAALALALCGDTDELTPLIDRIRTRFPEDTAINSIWLPTIRGALELRAGGAARAIDQLQTTVGYEAAGEFWPQYLRGLACLKLERGAEAAVEFQKILDHRGHAPLSPLYVFAHLGLARAAASIGETTTSRNAYDSFFTLWKDADADQPILLQARQEYLR